MSTLEDLQSHDQLRRGRWLRRAFIAVLAVLVVIDLTGLLGVHTSSKETDFGGYQVRLDYPRFARAGQDVLWRVTLRHEGGFGKDPIVLAVSADYFDIFETQGFYPDPDTQSATTRYVYYSYQPPPGDTMTVTFDAYIQPGSQIGRSATLAVTVGSTTVSRIGYHTWLAP
jgi:hypothetical protein